MSAFFICFLSHPSIEPNLLLVVRRGMKTIWIIFLFVSANGFSQDTLAHVTIHTWAGGVCCSSGTDITITLSGQLAQMDFDSLVYVSSNGQNILLYSNDFHAANTTTKPICSLTFGWSSARYITNEYPETSAYYGLPESRFRNIHGELHELRVYRNNQVIKKGKVSEQFTMTAYP